MATSVTQSLFGMTPQAIQAQRAAELNQQAMQFAQLNPMQQAQMGMFRAGSQLGTGLAGAMGYEDPEIAQARARQGMLSGVDMNDPQSLLSVAQQAQQAGDFQTAQALVSQANELQARQATTTKALTEVEREQNRIRNATRFVQSRIPDLSPEEAEAIAVDKEAVRKLVGGAKPIKVEADGRVRLVNAETGETIKDLGAATDRRPVTSISVDARAATGVAKLVNDFESGVKNNREALENARTAQNLINESIGSNNSQAWEQARTLVAKATGKGSRLSNEDIRRTGVDPRLVQGVADWLNKKTVGVPNEDIQRQLFVVARALERDAAQGINRVANRMRAVGEAEGLDPDKLDIYFPGVERTEAPQGAVNWSDLQ